MARFYDTMSEADERWITALLKEEGIDYSVQIMGEGAHLKEIMVAEEDLAAAERLLDNPAHHNT